MHPETTSPWPAVSLTLASAAIIGTVAVMIGDLSSRSNVWLPHGLATGLLVLAAGMALGPRAWQRRGINVVAWVLGFSLFLSLVTLWSVAPISLIAVVFLFASMVFWPCEAGEKSFGWTQVWYESLGFLMFLVLWMVLIPSYA